MNNRQWIKVVFALMCVFAISSAQTILWNQTYPDSGVSEAHSICQLADQGFYTVGSVREPSGAIKAHSLQTTPYGGQVSLQRSFDGNAVIYDCKATFDHGRIVVGYVAIPASNENLAIAKFDSAGNCMFYQNYNLPGSDRAYTVAQTPDSGYWFAGNTGAVNPGDTDIVIVKVDKNGTLQIAKAFGAAGWDCCFALVATSDGGCVFAGGTSSISQGGGADVVIAKLDALGNPVWAHIYGGAGDDIAYNLTKTIDGGYALAGSTSSFGGVQKAFLLKVDSLGLYQWAKLFGDTSANAGYGVVQLPDSGFMLAGNMPSYSVDSSAVVIRTNANGDSVGIFMFRGYIAAGGSPLCRASGGRTVLCYNSRNISGDTQNIAISVFIENIKTGSFLGLWFDGPAPSGLYPPPVGTECLVSLDPFTGLKTIIDSIPNVKFISVNSQGIDQINARYTFLGYEGFGGLSYYYTLDFHTGALISKTQTTDTINQIKYDPQDAKYYGLWAAGADNEYFVSLDPITGVKTIINSVPNVRFAWNGPVIDQNNSRYFLFGKEGFTAPPFLYTIDIRSGLLLAKIQATETIDEIEFCSADGKLYGLWWDGTNTEYFVSFDPITATKTIINKIPCVKFISIFNAVIDQNNSRYIFVGSEGFSPSPFYYYILDIRSGDLLARTQVTDNIIGVDFIK